MGLFGRKKQEKKGPQEEKVLQQDLSQEDPASRPGGIFMVHLLMKGPCKLPGQERLVSVMERHIGKVAYTGGEEKSIAMFFAEEYPVKYKDGKMGLPSLIIAECTEFDEKKMISDFNRSQFWNHKEDADKILSECRYGVLATDFMAGELPAQKRAELDMDYVEALVELYPECEAVYFRNAGKLFLADEIRNYQYSRELRYVYFAVNARLFNIQGKEEHIVDTLGMALLKLPDLQYHFHPQPSGDGTIEMIPGCVAEHAYNMASYILNNSPSAEERFLIKDGETTDGIRDGQIVSDIQWKCHYEDALIRPPRLVLDIYMNEYAAGQRE